MPPRAKSTTTVAKKPVEKAGQAFIFFNCDGAKSEGSKNVFYNREVFRDQKGSRKALWAKIQEELDAGRIQIAEESRTAAQDAVLTGNPSDANQYIQFGDIFTVDIY